MKKITTLLMGLLLASSFSFGQYYYVGGGTGNPGNLNADSEFPAGQGLDASWTTILGPSIATPTWSPNQTIPFTFNFNGSPVTQYKVSSTGVLTFTTAAVTVPGATNAALPSASIPDASVCLWGLQTLGTNDNIVIKTFGTAPNRQQWVFFTSHDLGGGWSYWSIVLEETSDRIYIVDQRHSGTTAGVTAGVQINGTTASSVLTSPSLQPLAGADATPLDNIYYEFIQGTQPAVDIELTSLTNLPYAAAGNLSITGVLTNLGANTVNGLTLTYNDGSGAVNDNLTGLNIPSGGTYNFSHATQLAIVAGSNYALTVDATIAADANTSNNSGNVSIAGLTLVPTKVVVGEEKTGSWCGWCPRGAVGLAGMEATSDFIGIAVHNSDPMTIANYDAGTATYHPDFTGYPHGAVDRVIGGDPSTFNTMHTNRVNDLVPCDVKNIVATINNTTGKISVSADAEFYGSITGNYRMSCVIIEDDVIGSGAGWSQVNYYNGTAGSLVDPVSGFDWGSAGDPVATVDFGGYDHVARTLSNDDILGDAGSLTTNPGIGVQSYTFADVNSSVIDSREKAHAVVMIIDANTGEILNAGKASIDAPVSVENVNTAKFNLKAFPNPTNEVSTISFNLAELASVSVEVFNNIGSVVFTESLKTMNQGTQKFIFNGTELPAGIYFVNLKVGEQTITQKVSLIK